MYILRFVGAIVILSFINWKLTGVLLLFVPILLGITWYFQRKLFHIYKEDKEMVGEINGFLENSLNGSKVAKAFTNEEREVEKYKAYNKRLIEIKKLVHKMVIAHRLSAVKNTDRIYVFSHKGIEEIGTHEQLMNNNGYYAKMYMDTTRG